MLDWLIVGGGLHGRFVGAALTDAAPGAEIAVLDDQPPLAAWRRRADACGMAFLRSSGAHHLGQRADSLRRFAAHRGFDAGHRLGYYRRPSRALFEAHAEQATTEPPTLVGRAVAVEPAGGNWRIATAAGTTLTARRVVLALGPNAPYRPPWGGPAEHVFDAGFDAGRGASDARVAVIGGGITGAQLALSLSEAGRTVCWVTRTAPRAADFDSDPCYAGAKCLAPFARQSTAARSDSLARARLPGTLPPDIMARIAAALAAGTIAWRRGEIATLDDAGLRLVDGRRIEADRVILATGFEQHARADSLLGATIARLDLTTDKAGHVRLKDTLESAPGLHMTGRPASLQLGPMAGNIRGARLAGQRLLQVILPRV
ncbi:FAD/NAD(P)-binding protein [Salinisphaera sp. T31B1]|uniref:FAD/NAD(P)-binding protein n=1 Tax=Salinisphaera sp. T31B1 TaxID=727963 RepID=UPI00333F8AB4